MKKGLSKKQKQIGMYVLSGLVLVAASGVTTGAFMHKKLVKQQEQYDAIVAGKDAELDRYKKQSVQTFVVNKQGGLKAGDTITEADIKPVALPDYFVPLSEDFVTNKEDLIGKVVKLDSPMKSYFLNSMVYLDDKLDPSSRKFEVDFVRLPYKLQSGEKVDINIAFPDGTNYRVITKKKLDEVDLPAQMIYFNGTGEERLLLNSALVDAYLNLGEIYVSQYVEAEMQEKATVNYIPRVEVLNLMQSDPQIVEKARWDNMQSVRRTLDQTLKSLNPADLKIKDGFNRLEATVPENSGVSGRRTNPERGPSVKPTTPPEGTTPVAPTPDATPQPAGETAPTQPAPQTAPPNTFGGK